jgi:hypothetical protein
LLLLFYPKSGFVKTNSNLDVDARIKANEALSTLPEANTLVNAAKRVIFIFIDSAIKDNFNYFFKFK